uniref:Uncharacterized protein n=1 Tax=Cacopsylla melanoneura TaxID=428564 RepID=A0A8D8Z3B3_9HEMI
MEMEKEKKKKNEKIVPFVVTPKKHVLREKRNRIRPEDTDVDYIDDSDADIDYFPDGKKKIFNEELDEEDTPLKKRPKKEKKAKETTIKRLWTEAENKCLMSKFSSNIALERLPAFSEIERKKKNVSPLKTRSNEMIRQRIRRLIENHRKGKSKTIKKIQIH